jgi:ATP-binding cassette subfamily B protein
MLSFYRTSLIGSSLGMLATLSAVIWLTWTFIAAGGDQSLVLLFLYWLMRLPQLSAEMATEIGQYPGIRNLVLRFNEIIEAPEEWPESSGMAAKPPGFGQRGVSISMSGVSVTLGAQQILKNINLQVRPGEHIAVVGPSGAGKSTLAGILMGWQSHYEGELLVNNGRLDGASLRWLRHHTAWVDPSVQIWNSPVTENILYGSVGKGVKPNIIRDAELQNIISSLPDDGNCPLGEGGGLVSGGEGQRVRLARALQRDNVRLAMLDEPFRGLDRETRHRLLLRCREQWADATLFFISHDLFESLAFDRVLVVENGEIVENDNPRVLMHDGASRYRALLEAEEELKDSFISRIPWRFLRMHKGRLHESESRGTP